MEYVILIAGCIGFMGFMGFIVYLMFSEMDQ